MRIVINESTIDKSVEVCYKLLNTEKFNVINEIEKKLPVKPFNDEWKKLERNKQYKDSTRLEKTLPIMFIVLYVIAIITIVNIKFCI